MGNGGEDLPPPDKVRIAGVTYGGNGCPAGSVGSAISDKRDIMTLIFDEFSAEAGPGIAPSKGRSMCQLNIKVDVPSGWSFTFVQSTTRGYAMLPKGVTGVCKAKYYFSGEAQNGPTQSLELYGPAKGDYTKSDQLFLQSLVYSPCGEQAMLNVQTSVALDHPKSVKEDSLLTVSTRHAICSVGVLTTLPQVDSHDLKFTQLYRLQWRRCPEN
ncbi:secreted protein [Colletotrichum musicola]|uniref:Secreted protein n=1 Tax=Colletotrichum musicola TaxID=2175873 RepID=A0A8H6K2E4_9PEZI|nr:secreted protein [Colletotrichum musicola]